MNDDAANTQEPDDDYHNFTQLLSIFALNTIYSDGLEELEAYIQIKDSRHSDRTKEADKDRLSRIFDLVYELVECEYHRETPVDISQSHKRSMGVLTSKEGSEHLGISVYKWE